MYHKSSRASKINSMLVIYAGVNSVREMHANKATCDCRRYCNCMMCRSSRPNRNISHVDNLYISIYPIKDSINDCFGDCIVFCSLFTFHLQSNGKVTFENLTLQQVSLLIELKLEPMFDKWILLP